MDIGRLRHEVKIQSASESPDSHGQLIETWTTDATIWSSIEPMSGDEKIAATQQYGSVTHKIRIRPHDSAVVANRIIFQDRIFEINAVLNWRELNKFYDLICTETV